MRSISQILSTATRFGCRDLPTSEVELINNHQQIGRLLNFTMRHSPSDTDTVLEFANPAIQSSAKKFSPPPAEHRQKIACFLLELSPIDSDLKSNLYAFARSNGGTEAFDMIKRCFLTHNSRYLSKIINDVLPYTLSDPTNAASRLLMFMLDGIKHLESIEIIHLDKGFIAIDRDSELVSYFMDDPSDVKSHLKDTEFKNFAHQYSPKSSVSDLELDLGDIVHINPRYSIQF